MKWKETARSFISAMARKRRTWARLNFEKLEDRLAPAGDPFSFQATGATPLLLLGASEEIRIVQQDAPANVLASYRLADIGSLRIEGNGHDVALTIDATVPRLAGGILFVGGAGSLEVAPGVRLVTTSGFPVAYKAEAEKGAHSSTCSEPKRN